jgi:hypothetical protein
LEILDNINGSNYEALLNFKNGSDYATNFDNQTIRAVVIKNWPNESFLYTVFLRLNTGSLKLSPQELRQALHPGDFLNYINEYVKDDNPVRQILKISRADSRMRDVELIIRYFSFKNFMEKYNDSLKDFLDTCCNELNNNWENKSKFYIKQLRLLEKAIDFTIQVFGERNRFCKYLDGKYTGIFNRTIFDVMVFFFSDEDIISKLEDKKEKIVKEFEDMMTNDEKFISATISSTKDKEKTGTRYKQWGERIEKICR